MEFGDDSDANEPTTSNEIDNSKHGDSSSYEPNVDPNLSYENKPGEILRNLQNVSYFYRQDVVRSKANNNIGIVTKVAGDSDSESSTTDDEDEDGDEDEDEDEEVVECGPNEEGDMENHKKIVESAVENTDDNDYKQSPLTADHIRVIWMDESETTESTNDVEVVNRGFLHGDYVASASDPTGQIGIVVDVNISVDLLMHDLSVLKDKSSSELRRIRDFTVGDHVVLGSWLGRIEDIFDNVTVLFDDGSVCKVMKADPLNLKPVGKNVLEDGHFPYYPGQHVKASSSSVFKNSRWLSGSWKPNRLEGTVAKVTVGSVFIYWIASAGYGPGSATTPAEEQSPKNLKLLSCFAHTNWQLGDWCFYSADDEPGSTETCDGSDAEVSTTQESTCNSELVENYLEASLNKNSETSEKDTSAEPSLCPRPLHRKKIRKVVIRKDKKARKKVENFERALSIINTRTKVDVAWQDGTIKRGLDSTSLIPIGSPGDHEFVAEQYVVEKDVDDTNDGVEIRRVGVVKSVSAKDRTACVRWLKPVARAEDPKEFKNEEVVSVYELEGHPDYDYCYGDVVVRLSPVSLPVHVDSSLYSTEDRALSGPDKSTHDDGAHNGGKTIETVSADNMSTEFSDLSWVGNITGLRAGDIEVTWADGMISTVGPQAIYVVDRDDDESIEAASNANDDAASWETVEDDKMEAVAPQEHGTENGSYIRPEIESSNMVAEISGTNDSLLLPFAALGFMTRLASEIFSTGLNHSDPLISDIKSEDDLQSDEFTMNRDHESAQKPNDIEHQLSDLTKGEEHDVTEGNLLEIAETLCSLKLTESDAPPPCDESTSFKGFDVVRDPFDHYFLGSQGQNSAARKWLKKVQQDWKILQNNLPEGIYVRAYEDRMDLLRAFIVGAYGTPYQDGLFFFDFHLPPEYPDVPPSAHYHSGGWRINPNLYEEGKVCLSLLNTWQGRGNEVWDPSTSSILQVLVSLQGLVLNSRPYFNEAGYDKQVGTAEGEKNSLSYNENTFLLNCKTMMYLIRRPPKDFEELVFEHFRKRGYYILKACDAYNKGHLIGSLTKDASTSSDKNANSNSVGFRLMLSKVVPKLLSALNEVGAYCQEFEHLI
ncbi:hypothetical protein ACJIZ3_000754 [Penstemon smallii]|uniref:E2 ubiquitin-conjugating enzyme n=1 Tax=Penstemon smallii TaxID=265156 RepID=A0ABD3U1Q5_9LAMI